MSQIFYIDLMRRRSHRAVRAQSMGEWSFYDEVGSDPTGSLSYSKLNFQDSNLE